MESAKPYLIRCGSCRAKNRIPADKINKNPVCGKCHKPLNVKDVFRQQPVEVSDSTFETEVLQSPIPVLAFFWAPWCSVCQSVMPTISRIASGLAGRVKVARINTEQNPATASRFSIRSVPLMIIFDNGQDKDDLVGGASELDILKKLAPYY